MNKEQVHQHAINLMSEGYNAGRYAVRPGEERSWFNEARRLIDEEYAKAQAFDRIVEERNQAGTAMYGKDDDVVDRVIDRAFWNIDGIIIEYESGDS